MSPVSPASFLTTSDEDLSRAQLDELLRDDRVLHRFEHCVFDGEDLDGVDLRGAEFISCFKHSLLVSADLRGIAFRKQTVEGLNLMGADLAGCDFSDAVLVDCDLTNASLKNTKFAGADLRRAQLGMVQVGDLLQHFKGSTISTEQAAALVVGLGVNVV